MNNKHQIPVVIAVCGDPGGAKAVAPVIALLQAERKVLVRAIAYRETIIIWEQQGLTYCTLEEQMSFAEVLDFLTKEDPSILLTGTSFNGVDLEKKFIVAARKLSIPSLSVLDFWSHYCVRFSNKDGKLSCAPDMIAIMDDMAKKEMIAAGFDEKRLIVTGQPAFDDLDLWKSKFGPEKMANLRDELRVGNGDLMILFASQPLSTLYGTDASNPMYPGYTEKEVLLALIRSLKEVQKNISRKIVLVIRPHPREDPKSFMQIHDNKLTVIVSTSGNSRDFVMAADLVVGMTTALLVEACYLDRTVLSLQPGLQQADLLPTNRSGMSIGVYTEEDITPVIQHLLVDKPNSYPYPHFVQRMHIGSGATQRVVHCVYDMIYK